MQLSLTVEGVLRDVQHAFYGLCVNAGKQVLAAMMEADRVALCGAKNVPDMRSPGRAWRHNALGCRAGRPAHRHRQAASAQPRARRAGAAHLRLGRGWRPAGHGHAGLDGRRRIHAPLRPHAGRAVAARRAALGVQERGVAALGGADARRNSTSGCRARWSSSICRW